MVCFLQNCIIHIHDAALQCAWDIVRGTVTQLSANTQFLFSSHHLVFIYTVSRIFTYQFLQSDLFP
jgi:hypothetical protein